MRTMTDWNKANPEAAAEIQAQAEIDQRAGVSLMRGGVAYKGAEAVAYRTSYLESVRTDPKALRLSKTGRR